MSYPVTVQKIDGKLRIKLPEGVTGQDFTDFLNGEPDVKELELEYLEEKWTTSGIPEEWMRD